MGSGGKDTAKVGCDRHSADLASLSLSPTDRKEQRYVCMFPNKTESSKSK